MKAAAERGASGSGKGSPSNGKAKPLADTPSLPPYRPFAGAIPDGIARWALTYLETLAATGGEELAAQAAGVRRRQVTELADARPDFAEELDASADYYSDTIAAGLVGSPRPVGSIVALKARRPCQYLEPVIAQQITVTNNTLNMGAPPAILGSDPPAILRAWLAEATPATKALIAGGAAPPSLFTAADTTIIDADLAPPAP